jgi:hypothetical protein
LDNYTYSDASKLTLEKVCFGTLKDQKTEMVIRFGLMLKYEKLGTVAQPRPAIFNGVDKQELVSLGQLYRWTKADF